MRAATAAMQEKILPTDAAMVLGFNGAELTLDASGAIWWADQRTLLVADLHLEKASAYARTGQMLPPYDTIATLARLSRLAASYAPTQIVMMGDAFHDADAGERLPSEAYDSLGKLAARHELVWIAGNHDPAPPLSLPGKRCAELPIAGLVLRHIPQPGNVKGEIAGHLHPVARVATRAGTLRRRCFVSDDRRLILPAFGAFAGGLDIRHPAIAGLFESPRVHVLSTTRVLAVAAA